MTQIHRDRMTRRREEQLTRTRSGRYVDKSRYKGSRTLTAWYSFRLELIAEGIRAIGDCVNAAEKPLEIGKVRT